VTHRDHTADNTETQLSGFFLQELPSLQIKSLSGVVGEGVPGSRRPAEPGSATASGGLFSGLAIASTFCQSTLILRVLSHAVSKQEPWLVEGSRWLEIAKHWWAFLAGAPKSLARIVRTLIPEILVRQCEKEICPQSTTLEHVIQKVLADVGAGPGFPNEQHCDDCVRNFVGLIQHLKGGPQQDGIVGVQARSFFLRFIFVSQAIFDCNR